MSIKQVIVIRKDLNMRKGKIAAQAAHASMKFVTNRIKACIDSCEGYTYVDNIHFIKNHFSKEQLDWIYGSFVKIVVGCNSQEELRELEDLAKSGGLEVQRIVDNGATEFHGVPTLTCIAIGPNKSEDIDKITGHLELL